MPLVRAVCIAPALLLAAAGCVPGTSAPGAPGHGPPADRRPVPRPDAKPIPDEKSGISLEVQGAYGTDYLVERWYHDEKIDPRVTIYVKSDAKLELFHNAANVIDKGTVVGAAGRGETIRYRVDQNMTTRAHWTEYAKLYPAYTGPIAFDEMEYDPGKPVVGVTGGLPGVAMSDRANFYWRGMVDDFGDEWHTLAVADDDKGASPAPAWYEDWLSDGKIFYFVVNPGTPCLSVQPRTAGAQFYTTPPKAYNVPKIHRQTTYVVGDCDIELAALGGAQVQYSLRSEGSSADDWQDYVAPINTVTDDLSSNMRYELRYRIGSGGAVKTRIVHFDPAYPSDKETHPQNILWEGTAELDAIRDRMDRAPYSTVYDQVKNDPFLHRRSDPYRVTFMRGFRRNDTGLALIVSAFPGLIDGFDRHTDKTKFLRDGMLDNFLNLDPLSLEHDHARSSPTREVNYHGYDSAQTPLAVALAYDWSIREMRAGRHPHGFTAVEDHKLRDMLGAFANWTMQRYADPYPRTIDADGFDKGMWPTAWLHATGIIAAIMPNYDSDVYGTSGAPGGTFRSPRRWTPFPHRPETWWDVAYGRDIATPGYPDLARKSGFYGLLNQRVRFVAPGYWGGRMMGWWFYLSANFRRNFDGGRIPHWEAAFDRAVDGALATTAESTEHHRSVLLASRDFPSLRRKVLASFAQDAVTEEQRIGHSLWYHHVLALCLYDDE